MKFQQHSFGTRLAFAGLVLCISASAVFAAASGATPGAKGAITNAGPPKAVFIIPLGPPQGKDPFYPKSVYPYLGKPAPVATNVPTPVPVPVDVDLKLSGVSGTKEHPLAIINGKTFEAGEEGEVNTPTGKVHIRVLEIRADGVLVFANGQRKEIRMRGGL